MRRSGLLALAAALAGCGGHATVAPKRPSGPCREAGRAAVARATNSAATARTIKVEPGVATCRYAGGAVRADVRVDGNPQAAFRFDRTVVERGQVAIWYHRRGYLPKQLSGIGELADWFPADRMLLTTDGRRLISVTLTRRGTLALARALARVTLAPAR